jgi:3-oxoacyl-[acyl-carrier-protein] synthase-1
MNSTISISSVGMVSSVGLNAVASCAAIRARLSRFEEIPFHDEFGKLIIAAPVPEVVTRQQGYKRLAPMLCRAICECMAAHETLENRLKEGRVSLLVTVDELSRPDYPQDLPKRLITEIREIMGASFPQRTTIIAEGKTGIFLAIQRAQKILNNPETEGCIIASGDSLLNVRALQWLESQNRLKTENNSDGVIPGEAAAAFYVTRSSSYSASLLDIVGLGFGNEASVLEDDMPNLAVGLANALRNAITDAQIPLNQIDFRVGGMTGERLEFMEASTALARIQRVRKDNFELWVPAEKLGDVGAALSACMFVVTAIGIVKGYAPGSRALLFVSSNSSQRAACVVIAPTGRNYG